MFSLSVWIHCFQVQFNKASNIICFICIMYSPIPFYHTEIWDNDDIWVVYVSILLKWPVIEKLKSGRIPLLGHMFISTGVWRLSDDNAFDFLKDVCIFYGWFKSRKIWHNEKTMEYKTNIRNITLHNLNFYNILWNWKPLFTTGLASWCHRASEPYTVMNLVGHTIYRVQPSSREIYQEQPI